MTSPKFSPGSNVPRLTEELNKLLQKERPWKLTANGQGIERGLKFENFKHAWTFMRHVKIECCDEKKHHPEWSNAYNRVFIRWTTHKPAGLSERDIKMAKICDGIAEQKKSKDVGDEDVESSVEARQTANEAWLLGQVTGGSSSSKEEKKKELEQVEKEEGAEGSVAGIGGQPT